jgi:integrase/recombinase XerD
MVNFDYQIEDFMQYCESKNLSSKTLRSYEKTLKLFSRYLIEEYQIEDASLVTEMLIRKYINYIKDRGKYTAVTNKNTLEINRPYNRVDYGKSVSGITINNYIRNIRVFYNYLYDNRVIKENPIVKIKALKINRKVVGFISDEKLQLLLRSFDISKFHEYRDYIITQLIFDTGMRLGETLQIKIDEVDLNKKSIILPAENTKGKKDRIVFFSYIMLEKLKAWLNYKDRYITSEYIFCTIQGNKLEVRNFETNFRKYTKNVGIENAHPHQLRNNFAKRFLMQGGDIYTLSRILGHSSVTVTEKAYLDLNDDDIRKNYQKYSPLSNLERERC